MWSQPVCRFRMGSPAAMSLLWKDCVPGRLAGHSPTTLDRLTEDEVTRIL